MSRRLLPLLLLLLLLAGCSGPSSITTCVVPQQSTSDVDLMREVANIGDWAVRSPRSCRPLVHVYVAQVESALGRGGLDGQEARRYLTELRQDCRAHRYPDVKATGELMLAWARVRGVGPA